MAICRRGEQNVPVNLDAIGRHLAGEGTARPLLFDELMQIWDGGRGLLPLLALALPCGGLVLLLVRAHGRPPGGRRREKGRAEEEGEGRGRRRRRWGVARGRCSPEPAGVGGGGGEEIVGRGAGVGWTEEHVSSWWGGHA